MIVFYYEPDELAAGKRVYDTAAVAAAFKVADVGWLGSGSFGETWRVGAGAARRAVKIMHSDNYTVKMLEREVEGLRRGACANVVKLDEVREVIVSGKKRPALVFEFVPGSSVAEVIKTRAWPTTPQVTAFAVGSLRGLAQLHSKEAVHRDIKPENIMLRDGDWSRPVIIDFGLSKMLDLATVTAYPRVMGTAPYMSPEQIRGQRSKKATDLWCLGVVLHLLLSHEHPFYGGRDSRLLPDDAVAKLLAGPKKVPASGPLRSVVLRCLSPEMHKRSRAERALRELGAE